LKSNPNAPAPISAIRTLFTANEEKEKKKKRKKSMPDLRSFTLLNASSRQASYNFNYLPHSQLTSSTHTTRMALPISSPSPRLDRFQQAMESLYGSFTSIIDPTQWNPPPRSGGHGGRYLWTDAFGVVNLLTMHYQYNLSEKPDGRDNRYLILADRLVNTVHNVLGRTREGKSRLPGATDSNPLGGGLRIGKTDAHGPDADGQYHHYLTLWMFALNRMTRASRDMKYNRQAVKLAKAIHPKFFVDRATSRPRMVWKMNIELTKALVASEGNLDPIDGYVVFRLLQATAKEAGDGEVLAEEVSDYRRVMNRKGGHYVSSDPLDLGMTLWTAHWFSEREGWAAELAKKCFEQMCQFFNDLFYRNIVSILTDDCRQSIRSQPLLGAKHQISLGFP
jgi:hypothetical protein